MAPEDIAAIRELIREENERLEARLVELLGTRRPSRAAQAKEAAGQPSEADRAAARRIARSMGLLVRTKRPVR